MIPQDSTGLYTASAFRTLAFYGSVLVLCALFPLLMCMALTVFILRFYRVPIEGFFKARGQFRAGLSESASVVRYEVVPPGDAFATVPAQGEGKAS